MEKDLIIIGARGLGREVLSYALEIMETGECDWKVKGFLDDDLTILDGFDVGYPILGTVSDHEIMDGHVYICAVGDGSYRLKICREFQSRGAEFINFIHPSVKIRERVELGIGNIICPNCHINPDTKIGNFVLMNGNTGIAHDCVIGDGCSFMGGNSVNGNCILEEGVFMGSHSIIIPKRKIGKYAKISAGAVVFTNVKPNKTMLGNPAMVLK